MPVLTNTALTSFAYPTSGSWMGYILKDGIQTEPSPQRTPRTKEITRSQVVRSRSAGVSWGNDEYAQGTGKYGFPVAINGAIARYDGSGLVQPPRNRYSTYEIMDLNATLKLARKLMAGRILANSWTIRPRDGTVNPQWVKFIEDMCAPLRHKYLEQAVRYASYGWRPFELIWQVKQGRHWLTRTKALRPDMTSIITDQYGNFAGLTQGSMQSGESGNLLVSEYKAFKVTHDGDAGNHYGVSRHESAYDPWCHWQQTRIDQLRLSDKLAGVIPILRFPPGQTSLDGVLTDNSTIAQQILDDLAGANGVALQAYEWDKNDLIRNPDLAKVTDWTIDFYDAGNLAPAQTGMIATAEYDDKLMMRAWETPERSALESTAGGSRADSDTHTDSSVSTVEAVDNDLAMQWTQGPVNMSLLTNIGEEAVDSVVVSASPLVDRKRVAAAALLKLLMVDPIIRKGILKATDTNELMDLCEAPRKGDFLLTDDDLEKIGQENKMNSGSGNPTGAPITTGAQNKSVVGRPTGSITASNGEIVRFKDVRDQVAELYELVKGAPDED